MDRRRILVIEDEPAVRELLKLHLVNEGYEVLLAEDAIDGGRLLLTGQPDLLIVDPGLPYMSGFELVTTLIADRSSPALPVIFVTGSEQHAAQAQALGDACLVKPFYVEQLVVQVRRLLAPSADASTRAVAEGARAA